MLENFFTKTNSGKKAPTLNINTQLYQQQLHELQNLHEENNSKKEKIIKEKALHEIYELIENGNARINARINEPVEKAALILGKIESSKSALTHLLAEKQLNTKLENISLWGCYGFDDAGGVAQEIANAFYIKKLFETTKELKFVLVVADSSDIATTVEQFVRMFKDVTILQNSVSLVITQTSLNKSIEDIKKDIENIINENESIQQTAKQMLGFLLSSVHIFYQQAGEDQVDQETSILEAINDSTKYIETSSNLANIVISNKSSEFAEELFEITKSNLDQSIKTIASAIQSKIKQTIDSTNSFSKNLFTTSGVKSLLKGEIFSTNKQNLDNLDLDQICSFQVAFDRLLLATYANMNKAFDDFRYNISNILKIFQQCYSYDHSELNQCLSEFIQQIEYTKVLKIVCENKAIDLSSFADRFQTCKSLLDKAAETGFRSISLRDSADIDYYQKAIQYLEKYNTSECTKIKAEAYCHIAELQYKDSKFQSAMVSYFKAASLEHSTYEKIGDLLVSKKLYQEAIKCFKVVNNYIKVLKCFKELIKLNAEDADVRFQEGDYLFSVGLSEKAIKCYHAAFSLTRDLDFKAKIWNKIADVNSSRNSALDSHAIKQKASNKDFYNQPEIKSQDLYDSVASYFEDKTCLGESELLDTEII
jgi:hypothetical protein